MELYYEHYKENCKGRYWEEEKTLPYSILIREREKREELEKVLLDNGFECVVYENGYPLMYVNLTLKRFGRNEKACGSATINHAPMSLEQFKAEILMPYLERENTTKTVVHMSYLEAHKIVHEYIDVHARHNQQHNSLFLRKSDFKNTKEEIICAFKLFFALGYRYGGKLYTKQEWDAYKILFTDVNIPWMEDSFVDEFVECERILNDKSLWGRLKNRSAIPYVKYKHEKLIDEYRKEIIKNDSKTFIQKKSLFLKEISELAKQSAEDAKEDPNDEENAKLYCQKVYRVIGLTPREKDVVLFRPIPTLQQFAKSPEKGKYFTEEQKVYVFRYVK